MRFIALIACFGFVLLLLAACGSEESIPKSASTLVSPESSPKAQRMPAGPDQDAAILEEGGNINLALSLAQSGMGTWIVGDPTAVYGGIMTYRAALEAVESGKRGQDPARPGSLTGRCMSTCSKENSPIL